jgi:hypothetical protein
MVTKGPSDSVKILSGGILAIVARPFLLIVIAGFIENK